METIRAVDLPFPPYSLPADQVREWDGDTEFDQQYQRFRNVDALADELEDDVVELLAKIWEQLGICELLNSWDTTKEQVDAFWDENVEEAIERLRLALQAQFLDLELEWGQSVLLERCINSHAQLAHVFRGQTIDLVWTWHTGHGF